MTLLYICADSSERIFSLYWYSKGAWIYYMSFHTIVLVTNRIAYLIIVDYLDISPARLCIAGILHFSYVTEV